MAIPDISLAIGVDDRTKSGLQSAERSVGGFSGRAGQALSRLKLPALAVGTAIAGIATSGVSAARELRTLAENSQTDFEDFQRLARVTEGLNGNAEDLSDALREMQLRLTEASELGTGPAVDALRLLDIELEEIIGLDAPAQFDLIRNAISEVEDPALRLFAAEELLGGSAERLAPLLAANTQEYERLRAAADEMTVVTNENIQAITNAEIAFNNFINLLQNTAVNVIGDAVNAFDGLSTEVAVLSDETGINEETLRKHIQILEEETDDTKGFFGAVVDAARGVADFTGVLDGAIETKRTDILWLARIRAAHEEYWKEVEETTRQQEELEAQLLATRLDIDLARQSTTAVDYATELWAGTVIETNIALREQAEAAQRLKDDTDRLIPSIQRLSGAYAAFTTARNVAAGALSADDVLALGEDQFRTQTNAERRRAAQRAIETGNLPQYATGGIVTRPTLALVGERGPEAIIPLGDGNRVAAGGATINIYVQGNVYGDESDFEDKVARAVNRGRQYGSIGA